MIPAPFEYIRAGSLQQAIDLLQNDAEGTKLIAGGHTLIPAMKLRLASPALLVDIRGIEELKRNEIGDQIVNWRADHARGATRVRTAAAALANLP